MGYNPRKKPKKRQYTRRKPTLAQKLEKENIELIEENKRCKETLRFLIGELKDTLARMDVRKENED